MCNIRLKALNAEHAGAKLLIIIRTQDENHDDLVDDSFETLGMMVEIPTLTIPKTEGDKLKSLLNTSGDVNMKFQMPIPQSDVVDIEVYIKDNDIAFYQFIKNLKTYILQFEDKVVMNLHFFKNTADAKDVESKPLLQGMANCMDIDNLFDLVALYGESCAAKERYTPDCLRDQARSLDRKIYFNFDQCSNNLNKTTLDTIGSKMKELKPSSKSYLIINHKLYHGSIKPENVFEAVCGGFIKSPDNCLFLNNKYTSVLRYTEFRKQNRNNKTVVIVINIVILVFLLAMAGIAIFLIFGKIYQRILNERVASMVKDSISNYNTLKDNV